MKIPNSKWLFTVITQIAPLLISLKALNIAEVGFIILWERYVHVRFTGSPMKLIVKRDIALVE